MRRLVGVVVLCMAAVMFSTTALAQQRASAGVYGSVVDSQGAIIPGAKVSLLHVSTNQVRNSTTDPTGEFLFPLLPVGEYRITVEQSGFKRYEQTGLLLQVNDNVKVDVRLEGGELSTSVTFGAWGTTVETTNPPKKEGVASRRVAALPLNGRNLADQRQVCDTAGV